MQVVAARRRALSEFHFDLGKSSNPSSTLGEWANHTGGLQRAAYRYRWFADAAKGIRELVYELAKNASRKGWLVVSGLAQGIDSAAHDGAIVGGTGTVGVLASGISNTSKSWTPSFDDEICLVSQFNPTDPWSGPRAMQRNSTIASLSDRVLVAAAGTSGGSWEMAQLCLKRKKPLFVLDLETDQASGNQRLIKAGAIPVATENLEACLGAHGGELTLFD